MGTLLGPALHTLPHHTVTYLTGHRFFPTLVSHPFATGIHEAFYFAAGCCAAAAVASWLRGGKYYHVEAGSKAVPATASPSSAPAAPAAVLAEPQPAELVTGR
jgi:hypothetical protein